MTRKLGRSLSWVALVVALVLVMGSHARASTSIVWHMVTDDYVDKGPVAAGDHLTHYSLCITAVDGNGDPDNSSHHAVYISNSPADDYPLVYAGPTYRESDVGSCLEESLDIDLLGGGFLEPGNEPYAGTYGISCTCTLTLTFGSPDSPTSPIVGMVAAIVGVFTSQLLGLLGAAIALVGIVVIPALVMRAGVRLALRGLRRIFGSAS